MFHRWRGAAMKGKVMIFLQLFIQWRFDWSLFFLIFFFFGFFFVVFYAGVKMQPFSGERASTALMKSTIKLKKHYQHLSENEKDSEEAQKSSGMSLIFQWRSQDCSISVNIGHLDMQGHLPTQAGLSPINLKCCVCSDFFLPFISHFSAL